MVVKYILAVLDNSKWRVRNGNISFWWDNWLNEGLLTNSYPVIDEPNMMLADVRVENGWDIEVLERLVGTQKTEEICSFLGAHKDGHDLLVWIHNKDGCFTTKSAWQCVRFSAPMVPWAKWVWHEALPKKISVLMWKAFHNSLSVDDRLRRVGILITSKCNCCDRGGYEDLNHVLTAGDVASEIWKRFSLILGIPYDLNKRWFELVLMWFRHASTKSQVGNILGLIPSIIIWKLWQCRCKAQMEGKTISKEEIWRSICVWLRKVQNSLTKVTKIGFADEERLRDLNIPVLPIKKVQAKLVCWEKPKNGRFKLNIDGCSLGNQRSSALGLHQVDIESDSLICVSWVQKKHCGVWYLEDFWEGPMRLYEGGDFSIHHVYREGNALADFLAKMGAQGSTLV
ncbi:hypothetical protein I3760_01G019600 [Carya illinoinensis]|nr:hypothetical protein I3760_01G019600 [Carya illinoinensis]